MPPESKLKGRYDFSACTFRSLVPNPPVGIQRMIDRALKSIGADKDVLTRWSEPVTEITDSGERQVPERDFFPHDRTDICCADGVAFLLYQTGVVDLGRNKDYFKARMMNGKSMAKCIHWAHYYYPHKDNEDVVYELPKISTDADPASIDYSDWLPGDVFVYFNANEATKDPEGDHVNIYIGPFIEVVGDEDLPEPVYHMFNSSIGLDGFNAFCTAGAFPNTLRYCKSVGRTMVRTRVKAIEKLFRDMVGPPVVFADPKSKDEPPRAELAWELAQASGSPYPIGRSLTWHEGIHLPAGPALKSSDVECFSPGELVLVRFGKKTRAGDSSLVLARHRFLTSQARLLGPPPWRAGEKDDEKAAESRNLYSLYMQLAPLETYLDREHEIEPGIPALYEKKPALEGKAEPVPEGKALAPDWLRNLWPRRKPDRIDIVPDTAGLTLLALTRSGPGAEPTLTVIGSPQGLTTRVWHPLSSLESVTVDGTQYWLVPVTGPTNAAVWDMKIPPATVPPRKKLTYYNPATDNTIDLPLGLATSIALVHQDEDGHARLQRVTRDDGSTVTGDGGTLIRIAAHDGPGVILSSFHDVEGDKDQFDYDEGDAAGEPRVKTLLFKPADKSIPLVAKRIPLYTTTNGKDDNRTFDDQTRIDLAKVKESDRKFRVLERNETGGRNSKQDRAFFDLAPGVWMSEAEIAKAEKLLDDKDTSLREAIKKRLDEERSCLVGVLTDKKSGWEIKEGHLHTSGEPTESGTVVLYRNIEKSGLQRTFTKLPKELPADQEQNVELRIEPPPPEVSIYPLLTPQGRVQSAVFELMFGATEKGTNQFEINAIVEDNKKRKVIAQSLMRGDLVDLRTADGISQVQRNVGRDRIGTMGDIPAAFGVEGTVKGVHFQMFSGENLVDPGVAGSDGKIVPVPETKWLVYKDLAPEGFFAPDFVKKLVDLLRTESDAHHIDLSSLALAFANDNVVEPKEWLDFCRDNQRMIARLITVHKPEGKIDWAAEIKSDGTRGMHLSEAEKKALDEDTKELRWWKDDLSLEGIAGDEVFFYHPLRFIEWMNTGVDFIVTGAAKKKSKNSPEPPKPKITLEPSEGGAPVDLTADARGIFMFRTFVGEGEGKTEASFRVTLENVATTAPKFSVKVKRGEVHTIRLVQPSVELAQEYPHTPITPDFQVPVSLGGSGNGYFLADGNAHLTDAGYSEASIALKVNYNLRIPNEVELKLEGHESFLLEKPEVSGAKIMPSPVILPRSVKLTLGDDANVAAKVQDSVVEGARIYTVRINVTTRTLEFDQSATLTATVSGGDLAEAFSKQQIFSTRTIVYSSKGGTTRGEDVAKLQLYLSQIFAADDLPCYRHTGKVEYQKDPKTGAAEIKTASIDGAYGTSLARALWRFAYTYGRILNPLAPWQIETRDQKGDPGPKVTWSEMIRVSSSVLEGLPPTDSIEPKGEPDDLFAHRVGYAEKKAYNQYPVVDERFLQEIVERFKPPFVLPHIDVFFESTTIDKFAPQTTLVDASWNDEGRIGKSTVLPISNDRFELHIGWSGAKEERDGDLDIVIELKEKSAYTFGVGPGAKTQMDGKLRSLLSRKFFLYSNETISSKADDNVLTVSTKDGRKIGQRQLHGSRDLLKQVPGDACRDVALVQFWLSRIPDEKPGEFLYKKLNSNAKDKDKRKLMLIDGKWDASLVKALKLFQERYASNVTDFPMLANKLRQIAEDFIAGRRTVP